MPPKVPQSRLAFFFYFISLQKLSFLIFFISCFAAALSATIWPLITGNLIDSLASYSGNKQNVISGLFWVFIQAICFWLTVETLERLRGFAGAFIYPQMESNIRMTTFSYVNHHSHAYFSSHYVGGIANKIADLPRSTSIVIDYIFNNLLPLLVAIIFSSMIFLSLDFGLGLIWMLWLGTHVILCVIAGAKGADYSKMHSETRSELQGKIVDTLINHLNVKLFSTFQYEMHHISEAQGDEFSKNKKTFIFIEKFKVVLSCISFIGIVSLSYYSLNLWQHDGITLGNLITIFNTIISVIALAGVATVEIAYLFREVGVIGQALKLMRDPIDIKDQDTPLELKVKTGKIEFQNVTFQYRKNDPVFRDKSLVIKGGTKVGLVGFSGSGKSTFAHLMLRLFDIESGKILIDGQDISKVHMKSLRDCICLIPQEPILFNRTIRDNIRYSKFDATDEEILVAAKHANCHEFIETFKEGYDTIVGERGSRLSGGQKQRIAIARTFLKNSPILILDEATSALDPYSEKLIQDSLTKLMENKTTLIIAHKLNRLKEVDRVLVFNEGVIVEDGTHEELLELNGHYAKLWNLEAVNF